MEKRYAKDSSKRIQLAFASVFASVALAICVLACLLLPCKIAYADNSQDVLVAPVSNLEGNAYAGVSAVKLSYDGNYFYIPESYYVTNIKFAIAQYYQVDYCGLTCYYESESTPQTTTVVFADGVSAFPDVRLALKGDSVTISGLEITSDYTIKFIGYHTEDSSSVFVSAAIDGSTYYGFAPRSAFEDFVVPYHQITQAERDRLLNSKPAPSPEKGDIIPNTSLALRIVLIIGIAVPAIIIAILLFKPQKNAQGKSVMRNDRRKNEFDYDSSRTYRPDDRYDSGRNERYDSQYGRQERYDDDYRR